VMIGGMLEIEKELMYVWVYNGLTRSLKLTKLKIPELNQGELLIKVKACGICGSDLHLFQRNLPIRIFLQNFISNITNKKIKILGH